MQHVMSIACFLSAIRPPGVQFDNALLQIAPVDKYKCPYINDKNDVSFQLYTKYNPTVYQTLLPGDDEKLFASNLDLHLPTVIFFHAFMERSDDGSGVAVREAYMQRGDTNIIMVDAQTLEAGPWYFTAAENTWFIGRYAAQFIDYLVSRGLDLSKTHLVGHSLGAQAAGVAGASLKSGRVARITGLDPALPLFSKLPLSQRLDPSDADFVDIIHTDAGIFGYAIPMGHADFYPNGGISPQPGCELEVVLHQQQFFNKCENDTQPLGYYTYYLTPNKRLNSFENKLEEFFTHSLKTKTKPNNVDKQSFSFKDFFKSEDRKRFLESITLNTKDDKEINVAKEMNEKEDIKDETKHIITNTMKVKVISGDFTTTDIKKDDIATTQITDEANVEKLYKEKADLSASLDNTKHNTNEPTILTEDYTETPLAHKVIKRQKRFLPFFKQSEPDPDNFLFKMLDFLFKNRKNVIPVFSVMREINTLVKSANGELNHVTKERNNYIGAPPPTLIPITYNLELANENKAVAFMKKLFGLTPKGDRLTISGK